MTEAARPTAAFVRLLFIVAIGAYGSSAFASEPPSAGQREMQEAVMALGPGFSTDERPVDFTLNGVHYRIPRNYIVSMTDWNGTQQAVVTLRINLSNMRPLTAENSSCLLAKPTEQPPECMPFDFWIQGSGPPDAELVLSRQRKFFRSQVPLPGPSGLQLYEIGPDDSRIETYMLRTPGRLYLYNCQVFLIHGQRDAGCNPVSDTTASGTNIHYHFGLRLLEQIVAIDDALRALVDSFVVN